MRSKPGLLVLMLLVLTQTQIACATKLIALGDWGRPSHLNLPPDSLKDLKLHIRCDRESKQGELSEYNQNLCLTLKRYLQDHGAKVLTATQAGGDLTVWYVDQGVSEKRGSALSMAEFLFSFGTIPYISSSASEAELRLVDARGIVQERIPLRVESVKALGWSSLAIIFQKSTKKQQQELGRRFFELTQNELAAQARRLKSESSETL